MDAAKFLGRRSIWIEKLKFHSTTFNGRLLFPVTQQYYQGSILQKALNAEQQPATANFTRVTVLVFCESAEACIYILLSQGLS